MHLYLQHPCTGTARAAQAPCLHRAETILHPLLGLGADGHAAWEQLSNSENKGRLRPASGEQPICCKNGLCI